jgi:hypothetical protein
LRQSWIVADVGNSTLLFSEAAQEIYELNASAAFVWRSLDAGVMPRDIILDLTRSGLEPDAARRAVDSILSERRSLEAVRDAPPSPPPPAEKLSAYCLLIAGLSVQLYLSRELLADVEAAFGDPPCTFSEADILMCARAARGKVRFSSPGKPEISCSRSEFVPLLKAQIMDDVLRCADYEVALHAAAVSGIGGTALLIGSPGAGKSTLGIALVKAGFSALADDVVLLKNDGRVVGLGFPFTAKASSWDLLTRHWPGIVDRPTFARPDGQRVRYLPADRANDQPHDVSLVLLLDRRDHGDARAEEVGLTRALGALLAEGVTRDERLSTSGFTALVNVLRDVRCYRLTYNDFVEAAGLISRLDL